MKKNYQQPAMQVVKINTSRQFLDVSQLSSVSGNAGFTYGGGGDGTGDSTPRTKELGSIWDEEW